MAAGSPALQRARRPLHGGARPEPLHLLQVMRQKGRGCPNPGMRLALGGARPHHRAYPRPHPSFRMRQVNIVGTSPPSQPSRKIQTLQAPPDMAPANVTLRTASETSLWLRWMVRLREGGGAGYVFGPHHLQRCRGLQGPHRRGISWNTYSSPTPRKVPDNQF